MGHRRLVAVDGGVGEDRTLEAHEEHPYFAKGEDRGISLRPKRAVFIVSRVACSDRKDRVALPWEVPDEGFVTRTSVVSDGFSVAYRRDLTQLRSGGCDERDPGLAGPKSK